MPKLSELSLLRHMTSLLSSLSLFHRLFHRLFQHLAQSTSASMLTLGLAIASPALFSPAALAAAKAPAFTLPAHAKQTQHSLPLADGKKLNYELVAPSSWTPAKAAPVLLLLPPGGQNAAMVSAALHFVAGAATRHGWVVICPQAPTGESFNGPGNQYLLSLLAALRSGLKIEGNRLHLLGISNGGRSALTLAINAPAELASVYVFPGAFGTPMPDEAALKNLRGLPVRMFVGEQDDASWHKASEASVAALQKAGVDARLEVRKGEGHILNLGDETIMQTLEGFRSLAPTK